MLLGFQFAWKMLKKRPLRMGLALLQVAAGVAAVAIVLSFIFSMLGLNDAGEQKILQVSYGDDPGQGVSYAVFTGPMIESLKKSSQYAKSMSIVSRNYEFTVENEGIHYRTSSLYAVGVDFARIAGLRFIKGNFFTKSDIEHRTPVVVISDVVNRQLFGNESGIGKKIWLAGDRIPSKEVKIVGIFAMNETLTGTFNSLHILFPYSLEIVGKIARSYVEFWAQCKAGDVEKARQELTHLIEQELRSSRDPVINDPNLHVNFQLRDEEIFYEQRKVARTFGFFIGSFALVSIVITSMGILSMLLVSIMERTREIGLRRALGATKVGILGQIISESLLLSFIGGVLGLLIALLTFEPLVKELFLKDMFKNQSGIVTTMTIYPALIALGTALFIGFIVGLYPGLKAANYVPVEAIRDQI